MAIATTEEKNMLMRCLREFEDRTFIVKEKEKDFQLYRFLQNHEDDVRSALELSGYELAHHQDQGVYRKYQTEEVSEIVGARTGRLKFTPEQISLLFILWGIHAAKSFTNKDVYTTMGQLNDSLEQNNVKMSARQREEALKIFKKYKLIDFPGSGDNLRGDEGFKIRIYESVTFGMSSEQTIAVTEELTKQKNGDPQIESAVDDEEGEK